MSRLLHLDTKLSQRLTLPPASRRWRLARSVAHLGDGLYVFGGLGLAYLSGWIWDEAHLRQETLLIMLILLAVFVVITLIKFRVRRQRPRPPGEFVTFQYDAYSFPSGHSARLAALAVSVIFFDLTSGLALATVAVAVSIARIGLGVHYLSDILIGLVIGALVAWEGRVLLAYLSLP